VKGAHTSHTSQFPNPSGERPFKCLVCGKGRCKATWKSEFKLPWREAGPPNQHDDKVDSAAQASGRSSVWCVGRVDARLPGKVNSNSHGARPLHLISTMTKWIRPRRRAAVQVSGVRGRIVLQVIAHRAHADAHGGAPLQVRPGSLTSTFLNQVP